jgi:hypothetical protein
MGGAKEFMLKQYEDQQVAEQIAIDAGVLAVCEWHQEVYDGLNGDNTPAYELGAERFKAGKLKGAFSDIQEMNAAIDQAVKDSGMGCSRCESDRASD